MNGPNLRRGNFILIFILFFFSLALIVIVIVSFFKKHTWVETHNFCVFITPEKEEEEEEELESDRRVSHDTVLWERRGLRGLAHGITSGSSAMLGLELMTFWSVHQNLNNFGPSGNALNYNSLLLCYQSKQSFDLSIYL